MADLSPLKTKLARVAELNGERSTWLPRYREITEYLLPYSGRYFVGDRNKGNKSFNTIYDSTATRAARILAAGLMAGVTSPARPWFRLATPDNKLNQSTAVKQWLADVAQQMRDIFAKSNTYRALHTSYEELGAFGTSASIIDDNYDTVLWQTPITAGEYCIAVDHLGRVDTLSREFEMTVDQMVAKFGLEKCSSTVKTLHANGRSGGTWVPVTHLIAPRPMGQREYGNPLAKNMPVASCYIEAGANEDQYLRESGYEEFPVLAPRWNVRGGDIYGNGPAFEALCDVKQLQQEQLRKGQGIDYMTRPPLQMPTSLRNNPKNTLPGGIVYHDATTPHSKISSLWDVRLDLSHLRVDIQDVQQRINQAFYVDLFLMMANDNRSGITATEIAERHEEKLLMLGPVLERLHDEELNPLIDNTFAKMVKAGTLPPPPPEMHGVELSVQFISVLAQAQRAVGLGSMDRLLGTVQAIGAIKPEVYDKLDTDEIIDRYSDMLGVDPSIIVADDKVAVIRESRRKAQAAAQQAAMMQPAADAAAKLGSVDTSKPNMATDVMRGLQGYT